MHVTTLLPSNLYAREKKKKGFTTLSDFQDANSIFQALLAGTPAEETQTTNSSLGLSN